MAAKKTGRRVVVTGYGMITPLGKNTEQTFEETRMGNSGIDYIKSFETRGLPCQIGGEVNNAWLEEQRIPQAQKLNKLSSRGLKLMIQATSEASAQAGLDKIENRTAVGVSLGSHGDNPSVHDIMLLHRYFDGSGNWDTTGLMESSGYPHLAFYRRKPDIATSILAVLFDCRGPTLAIVSACSAGSQAIGEAFHMICEGKCDVMLAGGCEATLDFMGLAGFTLLKALSEKYPSPQKASRPFDRKRNGFVLSEGAGVVVLEELEHARSRGVPIQGELLGYGSSADAYRITDPHPEGKGALLAMRGALQDASLELEDIDYINAHGTSTILNDITETRSIKELFGEKAKSIPVSSNKSMLGHTIAAAGAIELILTLVGMNRSIILPTINYEFPDPKCDLDYVPNESREQEYSRALSNSFGFGGQNACLCVGKFKG